MLEKASHSLESQKYTFSRRHLSLDQNQVQAERQQHKLENRRQWLNYKIDLYRLSDTLAAYCLEHFSTVNATTADLESLVNNTNCSFADLKALALVLAGRLEKVNDYAPNASLVVNEDQEVEKFYQILKTTWEKNHPSLI